MHFLSFLKTETVQKLKILPYQWPRPIYSNQCHSCWWPGSMPFQGISSDGIYLVLTWCLAVSVRKGLATLFLNVLSWQVPESLSEAGLAQVMAWCWCRQWAITWTSDDHVVWCPGASTRELLVTLCWICAELWFYIKMSSYQYRKSHCGDKTVTRSSYLHNGISYTGKMTSLYWIRALVDEIMMSTPWALVSWHVGQHCLRYWLDPW